MGNMGPVVVTGMEVAYDIQLGARELEISTESKDLFDPLQRFRYVDPVKKDEIQYGRAWLQMTVMGWELVRKHLS